MGCRAENGPGGFQQVPYSRSRFPNFLRRSPTHYFFARPRGTDAATFQSLCHTEVGAGGRVEAHCWYGPGTRPAHQRHADEACAACPTAALWGVASGSRIRDRTALWHRPRTQCFPRALRYQPPPWPAGANGTNPTAWLRNCAGYAIATARTLPQVNLVHPAVTSPELRAELEFLDLSGRGARDPIGEQHLLGHLVSGETATCVFDQFDFGHIFAVS